MKTEFVETLKEINRFEKERFLLAVGIFKKSEILKMDDEQLDELVKVGLKIKRLV